MHQPRPFVCRLADYAIHPLGIITQVLALAFGIMAHVSMKDHIRMHQAKYDLLIKRAFPDW